MATSILRFFRHLEDPCDSGKPGGVAKALRARWGSTEKPGVFLQKTGGMPSDRSGLENPIYCPAAARLPRKLPFVPQSSPWGLGHGSVEACLRDFSPSQRY